MTLAVVMRHFTEFGSLWERLGRISRNCTRNVCDKNLAHRFWHQSKAHIRLPVSD